MDIDACLNGKRLYGDDFSASQIAAWYADEEEGYANLGARQTDAYSYGYHALNAWHGFRHLRSQTFEHVMGFGSAYGDELLPILARARRITIVDPSKSLVRDNIHGVPTDRVTPSPSGVLPFANDTFDLITCLGVLHHIPNVSFVLGELARTLRPGGALAVREPIVSMGDWRKSRPGLTKRERGIPLHILKAGIERAGLVVDRQALCGFPLTPRLFRPLRPDVYNSRFATRVDAALSAAFAWNLNYHPRSTLQRLRPTSAFLLLHKPTPPRGDTSPTLTEHS